MLILDISGLVMVLLCHGGGCTYILRIFRTDKGTGMRKIVPYSVVVVGGEEKCCFAINRQTNFVVNTLNVSAARPGGCGFGGPSTMEMLMCTCQHIFVSPLVLRSELYMLYGKSR